MIYISQSKSTSSFDYINLLYYLYLGLERFAHNHKGNSTCDEKLRIVYTNFDKSLSINSCNAEK